MTSLIKYMISCGLGLALGYWLFSPTTVTEAHLSETPQAGATATDQNLPRAAKTQIDSDQSVQNELRQTANIESNQALLELQQKIEQQSLIIADLESQLRSASESENAADLAEKKFQTISMDDFESQIQNQFVDRFRGLAIELKGEQLKSLKREFEKDMEKLDWSAKYEYRISNFIQNLDQNGLHFVDELNCKKHMCRLTVNSSDASKWSSLYLALTQEKWFQSVTFTENSGDPNRIIYYITEPRAAAAE